MRILIIFSILCAAISLSFANPIFYNEYLEEVEGIESLNDLTKSFREELEMEFYEVNGETVVEVYIKSNKQLLGVMLDIEKVHFSDLKVIKENEMMASYLDKYPTKIAVALYQKDISEGMTKDHVSGILGTPVEESVIYDHGSELIEYSYANGSIVVFENSKVKNFIAPRL